MTMASRYAIEAPDTAYELERQRHVVGLANHMLEACRFDGLYVATGLVTIAQIIAGKVPADRALLAQVMIDAARELDSDVLKVPVNMQ